MIKLKARNPGKFEESRERESRLALGLTKMYYKAMIIKNW